MLNTVDYLRQVSQELAKPNIFVPIPKEEPKMPYPTPEASPGDL